MTYTAICLLLCLHSLGQNKLVQARVDSVISYSLPKDAERFKPGTKRINETRNNVVAEIAVTTNNGDIFIQLSAASGTVEANYLQGIQKGIEGMNQDLHTKTDNHFQTKSINNYQVLLSHTTFRMRDYYWLYLVSNDNKAVVNGAIEFPKALEAAAKAQLDTLLSSIKFK